MEFVSCELGNWSIVLEFGCPPASQVSRVLCADSKFCCTLLTGRPSQSYRLPQQVNPAVSSSPQPAFVGQKERANKPGLLFLGNHQINSSTSPKKLSRRSAAYVLCIVVLLRDMLARMSTAVVQRVEIATDDETDDEEIPPLLSDADSAGSEDDVEPALASASSAGATGSSQTRPAFGATAVSNGTGSAAHAARGPAAAVVQQVSVDDGDDSDSDEPPGLGTASDSGDDSDAPGLEAGSDDESPGMVPSDEVSSSLVCGLVWFLQHPHTAATVMRVFRHASPPEAPGAGEASQAVAVCCFRPAPHQPLLAPSPPLSLPRLPASLPPTIHPHRTTATDTAVKTMTTMNPQTWRRAAMTSTWTMTAAQT